MIVWYAFTDKANDAFLVNQIGYPSSAIGAPDLFVPISEKGKGDAVTFGKFTVRFNAISTDAQNLSVQLFKTFDLFLKSLQFPFSDRGEIGVVESQDHAFFS